MARVIDLLIRLYQLTISPLLGPTCRFTPCCSDYAREAVQQHGAAKGVWLAGKRLARCHPGCAGGHDPVPGNYHRPSRY